ncbi:hypothetical protein [Rosistilla oblonga]|uniref:hypothetical protein n=1 Tax=Rosistilla oblonga TaxID=2527990 RepID=UPI003A9882C5
MMRFITLATLLAISWVAMTFTHEMGHIIGGWFGGATLIQYDIAPWKLPFSIHNPDPIPVLTLWAGPVFGVVFPVGLAALIRRPAAWFVADFCILANGTYLAAAWISGDQFLDTSRMLDAGVPRVAIALYCVLTIGGGYLRFRADCAAILQSPSSNDKKTNSAE